MNNNEKEEELLLDDELKWGSEKVNTTVGAEYTYKDPNASTPKVEATVNNTVPESLDDAELLDATNTLPKVDPAMSTTVNQPVPPVANTVTNNAPNPEMVEQDPPKIEEPLKPVTTPLPGVTPVSPVPVQQEAPSLVAASPVPTPETQETPSVVLPDSKVNMEEEPPKKGKAKTILLILLFVFLLAFVLYLPDISAYIQLSMSKQNMPPATPTPSPSESVVPNVPSLTLPFTLEQISASFTEDERVQTLIKSDDSTTITSHVQDNTLTITYKSSNLGVDSTSTYTLEEDVLSSNNADQTTLAILVDVISILEGNQKNATDFYFTQDMSSYLLETDGIALALNEDGTYQVQIKLTQTMNVNGTPSSNLTNQDLESYTEELNKNDASLSLPKGDVLLLKQPTNSNYLLYIGEKNSLGDAAYQTLLTVVGFYLGNELSTFKAAYPSITEGEVTAGNVKISIVGEDEIMNTFNALGSYQVLKVEITK